MREIHERMAATLLGQDELARALDSTEDDRPAPRRLGPATQPVALYLLGHEAMNDTGLRPFGPRTARRRT
jgi:hypothetical protein